MTSKNEIVLVPLSHRGNCCDMPHAGEYRPPAALWCIPAAYYTLSLCGECLGQLKYALAEFDPPLVLLKNNDPD
jgi:hypothetical protein